ncbi:MAG: hypothetical protein ACTSRC_11895 [Candidatus Helarchaeota archaeon]
MGRNLILNLIYLFQVLIIFFVVLLIILSIDYATVAIIIIPTNTLLVMFWQEIKNNAELIMMDELSFDSSIKTKIRHIYKKNRLSRKRIFIECRYEKNTLEVFKIYFDIANNGNSDTTCHEFRVWSVFPEERELAVEGTYDHEIKVSPLSRGSPIQRRDESVNISKRQLVPKKSRFTTDYDYKVESDYVILRFVIYAVKPEAQNKYLFFFNQVNDRFFYTKCGKEKFFIKNKERIRDFLKMLPVLAKIKENN